MRKIKILWLAPNFNHYKARFLNHLACDEDVSLTILSGVAKGNVGHKEIEQEWAFELIRTNVEKKNFGSSKLIKKKLSERFIDYDWVLIPAEKKNIPLFLFSMKLRKKYNSVHLFSYNHAQLKSKNKVFSFLDYYLTKFYNNNLDRVVFYNESACKHAIQNDLVKSEKAFWANNTVDNTEIAKYYSFQLPPRNKKTILFIGRLIPSKRIADLIAYYSMIKRRLPGLSLEIIGDGPDRTIVEEAVKSDKAIKWHGTLVDEAKISPIIARSSLVFVPGLSGLSINHAFSYGRPYVTLKADKHGPEINYIDLDENGFVLDDNLGKNIDKITSFLENEDLIRQFCDSAKLKGEYLSVKKWVAQMKFSLLHEI